MSATDRCARGARSQWEAHSQRIHSVSRSPGVGQNLDDGSSALAPTRGARSQREAHSQRIHSVSRSPGVGQNLDDGSSALAPPALLRDRSGSDLSEDSGRWVLSAYSGGKDGASASKESALSSPRVERRFKRARRVDSRVCEAARRTAPLFALLDLDGTLFHMLPEQDLPGNLDVITEGVVPLPDAAMETFVASNGTAGAAPTPRHAMAVRRGTRALLAALRDAGAAVRIVTANLLGAEAVRALAAREDDEALSFARDVDQLDRGEAPVSVPRPPGPRGWSGLPKIDVDVVVDRRPGSKRLPDDVARALRDDPDAARVLILDDNPTAWEPRAKPHVWVLPHFDVRRPLGPQDLAHELRLLPAIADRATAFLAPASASSSDPAPVHISPSLLPARAATTPGSNAPRAPSPLSLGGSTASPSAKPRRGSGDAPETRKNDARPAHERPRAATADARQPAKPRRNLSAVARLVAAPRRRGPNTRTELKVTDSSDDDSDDEEILECGAAPGA